MSNIQSDWSDREFIQNIQYNLMKVAGFLNQFDLTCRWKLSVIAGKLTNLERKVEFLEASIKNVNGQGGGGQ